jgi:hypothetical protein
MAKTTTSWLRPAARRGAVGAEEIGQVSTTFKFVGANDKIVIEAFDDPSARDSDDTRSLTAFEMTSERCHFDEHSEEKSPGFFIGIPSKKSAEFEW